MTPLRAGILLGLSAVLFTACSSAPTDAKKKEPEKPPEALSGRSAFYKMYPSARMWATDVQVVRLSSMNMEGVPKGIRSPTPEAGQHTEEILRSLGYAEAEINAMRKSGAIG